MAQFIKEFSKNSAKNHENFRMKLELSFTLNSCKIYQKSSPFSIKILNFLQRSGGFDPSAHNMVQVLNYYLLSWAATREFQAKNKNGKKQIQKRITKIRQHRGLRPRIPWLDRIFRLFLDFGANHLKKFMHILKVINFNFPIRILKNIVKSFIPSGGGLHPSRTPTIACP